MRTKYQGQFSLVEGFINWHFCGKLFTHLVKRYAIFLYFQIDWDKEKIYFNARDLSCLFSYFLKSYFDLFLLLKVKVEFRHLFSLQKRFSLCSYHNINANIVVFADWLVYSGITLVFKFQAVWTTSYHTHFLYFQIDWDKEKIYFNARDLSCLFSYFLKLYFDYFICINFKSSHLFVMKQYFI
jgi:hypothetical protein